MFLKCYLDIPAGFDEVAATMLREPAGWLAGPATAAEGNGQRLLTEVGLDLGRRHLRHPVRVKVGEPQLTPRTASLPLRVSVQGRDGLFPSFLGSIDAAWLGSGHTHLALSVQYEPPFGAGGQLADRALFHRVAEVVADDFLRGVARRLAGSGPPGRTEHEPCRPAACEAAR